MKTRRYVIIGLVVLAAGLLAWFSLACNRPDPNAIEVTISTLVSSPEAYHGKVVRVTGYGNLTFEGDSVTNRPVDGTGDRITSFDCYSGIYQDRLWVDLGPRATPYFLAALYNKSCVVVEGTFLMGPTGHFSLYPGELSGCTLYQLG